MDSFKSTWLSPPSNLSNFLIIFIISSCDSRSFSSLTNIFICNPANITTFQIDSRLIDWIFHCYIMFMVHFKQIHYTTPSSLLVGVTAACNNYISFYKQNFSFMFLLSLTWNTCMLPFRGWWRTCFNILLIIVMCCSRCGN